MKSYVLSDKYLIALKPTDPSLIEAINGSKNQMNWMGTGIEAEQDIKLSVSLGANPNDILTSTEASPQPLLMKGL